IKSKILELANNKPRMQLDMSTVIKQIANAAKKFNDLASNKPKMQLNMSTVIKQIQNADQKFKDLAKTKPRMQLDMSTVMKQISNADSKIKALSQTVHIGVSGPGAKLDSGSPSKSDSGGDTILYVNVM